MSRDYITDKEELEIVPPLGPNKDQAALSAVDLGGVTDEFALLDLAYTGNRAFLTGGDIVQTSTARGSSMIKLVGTLSMAAGAFEGIDVKLASSGAFTAAGDGVVGVKCLVANTAHLVDGNIYGGQFIAKFAAAGSVHMHAEACLIALEAYAYVSGAGDARTVIGLNAVVRSFADVGAAGGVQRGIQVIIHNDPAKAEEVTGICIWNMNSALAVDQVLNLVGGAFTHFCLFTDDGTPAQSTSTTVTNAGTKGWIKVKVGAATRYIALCDGVT